MGASFADAAAIAARQNGRITTAQLRNCGFGKGSIEKAARAGRLHRTHVGVYAVGHLAPNRLGDWHGAVLACGEDAVLSVRCAATLWQIRDGVGPRVDVTIPGTAGRKRPGIAIHHADLAHHLRDRDAIEWAMREMQFRRLYDFQLVELSNRRRPNRIISALLEHMAPTGSPTEIHHHLRTRHPMDA